MIEHISNNESNCNHLVNRCILGSGAIALTAFLIGIPMLIFSHPACQKTQTTESNFPCSSLGIGTALTTVGFVTAIPAITLLAIKIFCWKGHNEVNEGESVGLIN